MWNKTFKGGGSNEPPFAPPRMVQSLRLYHFYYPNEGVWISGIRDSSLVHNIFCNKITKKSENE